MKVVFGIIAILVSLLHYGTTICYWSWTSSGFSPTKTWICSEISKFSKNTSMTELSRNCHDCMCQMISGCVNGTICSNESCGPMRISQKYWIDAGNITYDKRENPKSYRAHVRCLNDLDCTFKVVKAYMKRFSPKCIQRDTIQCVDYYRIHLRGKDDCNRTVDTDMENSINYCLYRKLL